MKFLKISIIILIIGISTATLFSFYIWNLFKENLFSLSNFNIKERETNFPPPKEYQIENVRFSLPQGWAEVKKEEVEDFFSFKEKEKKYNPELLFLAYKIKGKDIIQFSIEKAETKEDLSLEEFIDIIKKVNKEKGWDLKIISKDFIKNNILDFEAKGKKEGEIPIFIKERLAFFKREKKKIFYMIGIVVFQGKKERFFKEIEEIFNSIHFAY